MIEAIYDNNMIKGNKIGICCIHTELLDTGDGSIVDMYDRFYDIIETKDRRRFYVLYNREQKITYALPFKEETVECPSFRHEYSFMTFDEYQKLNNEYMRFHTRE